MTWIRTIPFDAATGRLRRLYERIAGPARRVDNIMAAHSLRPHMMEGHLALYRNVLHHDGNALPRWVLELIGVRVSALNGCAYCVTHHAAGLRRLLADAAARAEALIAAATGDGDFTGCSDAPVRQMLAYAERLTRTPQLVDEADIAALRSAGLEDGQILEVNQVVAYFAYANRTVLGLGVGIEDDPAGPGGSGPPGADGCR